jgi:hypothetical protein
MDTAPLRPLGTVMELIEKLGHEVTYAYEDLVFIDHNEFLLQFSPEPHALDLFFNTECADEEADATADKIIPEGSNMGLTIRRKGSYTMSEAPDNSLQIQFHS